MNALSLRYTDDGTVEIRLRNTNLIDPVFRLRDRHTQKFLTISGWSRVSVFLPCSVTQDRDSLVIALDPAVIPHLRDGMDLSLEESIKDFRENFEWQTPVVAAATAPVAATTTGQAEYPAPQVASESAKPDTTSSHSESVSKSANTNGAYLHDDQPGKLLKTVQLSAIFLIALMSSAVAGYLLKPGTGSDTVLQQRIADLEQAAVNERRDAQKLQDQLISDRDNLKREIGVLKADLVSKTQVISNREEQLAASRPQLTGQNEWEQRLSTLIVDKAQLEERIKEQTRMIEELRVQLSAALNTDAPIEGVASGGTWLAAAVDSRGAVEAATFHDSAQAAQQAALRKCGGDAKGCELIGTFENACFALSRPVGQKVRQNWWHAADNTWQAAERRALYECLQGSGALRCDIRISVCSPSTLSKP